MATNSSGVNDFIFEYSAFLITSARGTLDEPHTYGALRLMDGITRLIDLYSKCPEIKPDKFVLGVSDEIQANLNGTKSSTDLLKSEDRFAKFMDDLIIKFADEIKRRYAGRSGTA
jgi:hypothetical protein